MCVSVTSEHVVKTGREVGGNIAHVERSRWSATCRGMGGGTVVVEEGALFHPQFGEAQLDANGQDVKLHEDADGLHATPLLI